MLYGIMVRQSIFGVVDVGLAGIHYNTDMAQLDRTLFGEVGLWNAI